MHQILRTKDRLRLGEVVGQLAGMTLGIVAVQLFQGLPYLGVQSGDCRGSDARRIREPFLC